MAYIQFRYDIRDRVLCEDGEHVVVIDTKKTVEVHDGWLEVWKDQILGYCRMKAFYIRYNGVEYGSRSMTKDDFYGQSVVTSDNIFDIEFDFEFE